MASWLSDHRARQAAVRRLGTSGEIIARTGGGSPILRIGEHRLAYRRHGAQRYWRQATPCAGCGIDILFGDVKIEHEADLARLESVDGSDLFCHSCRKTLLHRQ